MLLPSYFVFDFKKCEDLPGIELPENAFLCYRITGGSTDEVDSFNKKLILNHDKNRFCLLMDIDGGNVEFEKLAEAIAPFTFHYNYLKSNYDKPLIIFEARVDGTNRYVAIAEKIFKSHGYSDVEVILLRNTVNNDLANKEKNNICFNFQTNRNNLFQAYTNSIKEITSADASFFFFLDDPKKLPEVLNIIKQSETLIEKEIPQTYHLLKECGKLKEKEQEMLFKIGLQEEELNSVNKYHLYYNASDTRYKRQITELLSFYKNEYEILPTWYKRLGHIIKVIMGKRTFHSLFNDNVKKYKD
jgi:hypothetical protein